MNIEAFAKYVSSRRTALGLSQEQVGDIAEVSKASISDIESAKTKDIKASTLIGIAKALKWTPQEAFLAYKGIDPDKKPSKSETEETDDRFFEFLKTQPLDTLIKAFQSQHSPQEIEQMIEETKKME